MTSLKTLALAAALVGATAVSAQAATQTISDKAIIPTTTDDTVWPYVYDFTLKGFDTKLGKLTAVEFTLTNNATAVVQVQNNNHVAVDYTDASASIGLLVTGPGGISDLATYTATSAAGSVPEATEYIIGGQTIWVPSTTTVASSSGSTVHSVAPTNLGDFEVGSIALSYEATSPGGSYSGKSTSTNVFFGGTVYTGGVAEITYTYTTVPEPSTWAMMGLGFAGLGFAGMRSTRKSAARAI